MCIGFVIEMDGGLVVRLGLFPMGGQWVDGTAPFVP